MESSAPLLNDYKLAFFAKRFPQTLLGGLKLRLGYEAPFYVYLNQVVFFLVPFILGGVFTGLSESLFISSTICCYVVACLVTCIVTAVNLAIWFRQKRFTNISKIQPNILAEEDEIEFESCCGLETLEFIFTSKKTVPLIFMHGLCSGLLCGLMFLYLLPSNLNRLFANTGATVVLYVFGWLTVCVAQYSLTASPPPEPATFRSQLLVDVSHFMRPFYVIVFGITGVVSQHYTELFLVDQILHGIFPFLLLLWMFGMLPPLDALFPWLLEQYLVFIVGGSPMATDTRLFIMVLISSLPVILAVFIPSNIAVLIISCTCGYILSLDLFSIVVSTKPKIASSPDTQIAYKTKQWTVKELIIVATMLVFGISCTAVGAAMNDKVTVSMFQSFSIVFCVLLVVLKVLGDLQGVYVLWIVRNPLYPRSIQSGSAFDGRKKQLMYIGISYHILFSYVCPLIMTAFLGLFLRVQSYEVIGPIAVLSAFGTVRVTRQVWQNNFLCLLDLCIVCLIDKSWWISSDLAVQLILTALCRDRALQLLKKTSFLLTLIVTSVSLKKQRHKATPAILALSILFIPVLLAILASTVILSSPLLPMFCLPVFLIGFPRPLRSWPLTGTAKISTGPDAVYYKQLTPEVVGSLTQSLASGALGVKQAGDHFIMRYQDRLVWLHIVESGYRFSSIIIKGLEMQETSCHTLEAARVDEVFETAFIRDETQSLFYLNHYAFNTLSPCDVVPLDSYSDAKNVLTGIIDQHENLEKVSENFLKTLLWVLIQHCKNTNKILGEPVQVSKSISNTNTKRPEKTELTVVKKPSRDDGEVRRVKDEPANTQTSLLQRSGSLPSINGSIWSQESFELQALEKHTAKQPKRLISTKKNDLDDLEDFLVDDFTTDSKPKTPEFAFGGFPALDTGTVNKTSHRDSVLPGESPDTMITIIPQSDPHDSNKNNVLDTPLVSKDSYKLDLPLNWKVGLPFVDRQLKPILEMFPTSWFQHIVNELHLSDDNAVANDTELMGRYQRLVLSIYSVVELLGYPGSSSVSAGPNHPYRVCNGEIPWSIHLDWLQKDTTLLGLVFKAYRYAFKMMYDEAVLGEITSDEECTEYLSEYDSDWYMGKDTDDEWSKAVLNKKPNLFSLGRNMEDGTYTSRVLTKQTIHAPIGQLNAEAVRGQWASLALELLYFTNDDEERYSIQAHPVLLRNLTIQAADPPLGYPVYSSGLVSVPVHMHR